MGSTEGNIYSLYNAREYLSGAPLSQMHYNIDKKHNVEMRTSKSQLTAQLDLEPVVFYSRHSHYSITKASKMLKIKDFGKIAMENGFPRPEGVHIPEKPGAPWFEWPHELPTKLDGSIDVEVLETIVEPFAKAGYPLAFILNLGTTFTNAVDPVEQIIDRVIEI
jgi:histidine decarboxylase